MPKKQTFTATIQNASGLESLNVRTYAVPQDLSCDLRQHKYHKGTMCCGTGNCVSPKCFNLQTFKQEST
jgi:hypothetical protein